MSDQEPITWTFKPATPEKRPALEPGTHVAEVDGLRAEVSIGSYVRWETTGWLVNLPVHSSGLNFIVTPDAVEDARSKAISAAHRLFAAGVRGFASYPVRCCERTLPTRDAADAHEAEHGAALDARQGGDAGMIGERFWSTGIVVRYGYAATYSATGVVERYGWRATCHFHDDGFSNDDLPAGHISTEGELNTRYFVGDLTGDETSPNAVEAMTRALTAAIDVVKRDAEALGIRFGVRSTPTIYGHGDGEDEAFPLPYGWQALLNAQAERLGWRPTYITSGQETTS